MNDEETKMLREALLAADAQIDAGDCIELDERDLPAFFEAIEREAMEKKRSKAG